jgi:hypothetical protein
MNPTGSKKMEENKGRKWLPRGKGGAYDVAIQLESPQTRDKACTVGETD